MVFTGITSRPMWVATYYGGLNLYDPRDHSFKRYQHNEQDSTSISTNKINSVFQDNRGRFVGKH